MVPGGPAGSTTTKREAEHPVAVKSWSDALQASGSDGGALGPLGVGLRRRPGGASKRVFARGYSRARCSSCGSGAGRVRVGRTQSRGLGRRRAGWFTRRVREAVGVRGGRALDRGWCHTVAVSGRRGLGRGICALRCCAGVRWCGPASTVSACWRRMARALGAVCGRSSRVWSDREDVVEPEFESEKFRGLRRVAAPEKARRVPRDAPKPDAGELRRPAAGTGNEPDRSVVLLMRSPNEAIGAIRVRRAVGLAQPAGRVDEDLRNSLIPKVCARSSAG